MTFMRDAVSGYPVTGRPAYHLDSDRFELDTPMGPIRIDSGARHVPALLADGVVVLEWLDPTKAKVATTAGDIICYSPRRQDGPEVLTDRLRAIVAWGRR